MRVMLLQKKFLFARYKVTTEVLVHLFGGLSLCNTQHVQVQITHPTTNSQSTRPCVRAHPSKQTGVCFMFFKDRSTSDMWAFKFNCGFGGRPIWHAALDTRHTGALCFEAPASTKVRDQPLSWHCPMHTLRTVILCLCFWYRYSLLLLSTQLIIMAYRDFNFNFNLQIVNLLLAV